ncbi:MAG: aminopeptidase P family protein [Xanthobacteraceae bacterium]|nr:MAG: aminopeptidase P family protein [Xanthobacteraceae bacterium]
MFEALFQSFEDPSETPVLATRLAALRAELARRGLAGLVIPRADQHQNEYVPACDERLAWLTGFTGSAGLAVVLRTHAALFVDGRYTLQARAQVDAAAFAIEPLVEPPPYDWIAAHLAKGDCLGFDPWLHTSAVAEKLAEACARAGASLVAVDHNPLDAIWAERPPAPLGPVNEHPLRFAGESAADKLARLRGEITRLDLDAVVLSDPHGVAWTFNIRGADVSHTPLPLAYALVPREGRPVIFIERRKLTAGMHAYLQQFAGVEQPANFAAALASFTRSHPAIGLDTSTAADALSRIILAAGGTPRRGADPVALFKAVKNATEIAGTRAAHGRDGAALARFLAWLDREAPLGHLTEIDVVEALETFRRDTGALRDISFPTIAGAGPHGAIVHYRVSRISNRRIAPGDLLLVDSGAQYDDGTTDVTRTIAVGAPSAEMRDRFTRVLKGHIAIARAVFPDGTAGAQLDALARQYLWQVGLDYDHGTGHGVGSFLSVHEGPARIARLGTAPLRRGMILSNEPGYYKAGAYGIRIENLVLVREAAIAGVERPMNGFETLTLAPIDARLIDRALLSMEETGWLDSYHAHVRAALTALVDDETRDWLHAATEPLRAI